MMAEMEWIRTQAGLRPLCAEVALWHVLLRLGVPERMPVQPAGSGALGIAESLLRNHLDRPMRIGELAARSGVSAGHLNRLFQQAYGHSAQEHLQQARLELALSLLRESALPVRVIAARVGLPDAQAFNKFIRKRTGLSPTGVRRGP
jgi:transcriptional regulator GlxA family with amidase domain